jgi:hypothetical protein
MMCVLEGCDGCSRYRGQLVGAEERGDGEVGQNDEEGRQLYEPSSTGDGINEARQGREKT